MGFPIDRVRHYERPYFEAVVVRAYGFACHLPIDTNRKVAVIPTFV